MTTPLWCLFVVALMPYLLALIGDFYRAKAPGGFDNQNPRAQIAALEGPAARAYAAQQNAWEALAVFTAVVVINHLAQGDPGPSSNAASLFVATRLVHPAAYIFNWDKVRSGMFFVGIGACIWLVVLAAQAGQTEKPEWDRVDLHHSSSGSNSRTQESSR